MTVAYSDTLKTNRMQLVSEGDNLPNQRKRPNADQRLNPS